MSATPRQVVEALKHRYVDEESSAANIETAELAEAIRNASPAVFDGSKPLLETVGSLNTDWVLSGNDIAVISSIEDCYKMIFSVVDLEDEVESVIRSATPALTALLLANPASPLRELNHTVFSTLDLLLDATIGWTPDQGRAGEKLLTEVRSIVEAIGAPEADIESVETDFAAYLQKDQNRIQKLEDRLSASETGRLRSQQCRIIATETINNAMQDKQLTGLIVQFLQGPWFESLQLMALTQGLDSEEWQRAVKMTETIVWTYQPIDAKTEKGAAEQQKLYRIVEHLPNEVRDLLVALEHSTEDAENAIADIEAEHVEIISGQELEYADFSLLEVVDTTIGEETTVSRILLRKVANMNVGDWFTYHENDKSARIKLVLKLEDVKQMLFTNRNGMKALQKSFNEMAYLMSSGVIKPLNHDSAFTSTFATFYQGLVDEHQKKLEADEQAEAAEAQREADRQKALKEAEALARANEEAEREKQREERNQRVEAAMAEAALKENTAKQQEFSEKVESLNIGAWLKLPGPDGVLEEAKLAVKVASADKMIFVSRTGTKIGEYSAAELISLLVTGAAEIDDTGVEFEDTLAQVVSKLRQDRDKSYDDLTGNES